MEATATKEEQFVDPVCGMTTDPASAAGISERGGQRYYFCSTGCKATFDAEAPPADDAGWESCCSSASGAE